MTYNLPNWLNEPAETSALSAENFLLMNVAIQHLDTRATKLESITEAPLSLKDPRVGCLLNGAGDESA